MAAMLGWKLTEARRQRQIARLEARRDWFLRSAHKRYMLQLLWKPLIFVVFVIICFGSLHEFVTDLRLDPPWPTLNHLVYVAILGLAAAVYGRAGWLLWNVQPPADGDFWAISDRCRYEDSDDDPRFLQARIDALRAQPVHQA
jgi:hypothetical protein